MEETGMAAFITALTTDISATSLWGAVAPTAPLIAILVLFALGLYVLRKNLKRGSKGKGGTV